MTVRIALGLEYNGSSFSGWQSQADGQGIQDTLEYALAEIAAQPVRCVAAGRTDAGVHASLQIVHFDTTAQRPLTAWWRGVNAVLPPTIAVRWAREVNTDFHARFKAIKRRYTYALLNRPTRPGLLAGRVGWYHAPLSLQPMREAASLLVGEHDFSAFRSSECQAKSPRKFVYTIEIHRQDELILFDFYANAFLHHMVRNLIGSLIYVGQGKQPAIWLNELLESRDRNKAAPTFAADGLHLTGIEYDAAYALPEAFVPLDRILSPCAAPE